MFWLILGVLCWSLFHLFPSIMAAERQQLVGKWGKRYKGFFALSIVLSLILIVIGWRSTVPYAVYDPPLWGRNANMLIMLFSVILFAASHAKTRIKKYIRHPMLIATVLWSLGHLLANGDIRSVILFGGLGIWSVVSIVMINRREGTWEKPVNTHSWVREFSMLGIAGLVYLALVFLHPYFAGMPLFLR